MKNNRSVAFQVSGILGVLMLLLALSSCKEKNYLFEVKEITVTSNNAEKDKEKTQEQFINILYANLYQEALSPNELVDISDVITSIGDKQVAYETVIAKMMKDPQVKLPTREDMNDNLEAFVLNTYQRFFVRNPTEAEKSWWINFLSTHPNLTPEHVYFAFSTCNEYYFY